MSPNDFVPGLLQIASVLDTNVSKRVKAVGIDSSWRQIRRLGHSLHAWADISVTGRRVPWKVVIGKRKDAIAIQVVTDLVLCRSRCVTWYPYLWVEENLRVQRFLTVVIAPESDRGGHVSASAVATTENCADSAMIAKVALDHCVVLIDLGWKTELWKRNSGASLYSTA